MCNTKLKWDTSSMDKMPFVVTYDTWDIGNEPRIQGFWENRFSNPHFQLKSTIFYF